MAHVLAGALPQETLDPVNREAVASGYGRGRYIRDVKENTPYPPAETSENWSS